MTRLIVGPFNRVEGDLEIALDIADDAVVSARVTVPLYRGFEQILVGRPAPDALVIAPRICGICSVSQSMAAAAALRALCGLTPARNGLIAANLAHAAENMADHLTHFYLFFMPDFARAQYAQESWFVDVERRFKAVSGSAGNEVLQARKRLLEIMGVLAGKWPHSLAFQPGGTTRAIDLGLKTQLIGVTRDFRRFLETVLFAAPLGDVLAIETPEQLENYAESSGARGDFQSFLRIAQALDLERLGVAANALLSYGAYRDDGGAFLKEGIFDPATRTLSPLDAAAIREDVAHAWMRDGSDDPATARTEPYAEKPDAYSWAKAPRLMGRPAEVGAVARLAVHGHPLIRALLARSRGSNVLSRVTARLIELAILADTAENWAKALALAEPFCVPAPADAEGQSFGLVEAARGSLGHWMSARKGKIRNYQIIAPTTWNFSPRDARGVAGPVEQALTGSPLAGLGARAAAVQHVVRSFDPCMVCTAH
ncbi:nickel-dependent hydrogenase large subunit [Methylocystis sp. ATCC 49242]|uniref:nickel-dependent hydrogenase large subunit n=1 Tax=Methylocystis sp. ATCC 49242 TaxID=622637 RepID=UPI0001F886AC|nr:nickel-dependent hydrogenase large subunit [Methylocystis sp. ATCC 49242]